MISVVNYALYIIYLILIYVLLTKETEDLYYSKESSKHGDGYGKFTYPYKYNKGDTKKDILKKIEALSKHDKDLPKWRRSLLVATIIMIIISIVVYRKLISFPKFFLYILVIFCIMYFSFNYYDYHHTNHALKYTRKNLEKL